MKSLSYSFHVNKNIRIIIIIITLLNKDIDNKYHLFIIQIKKFINSEFFFVSFKIKYVYS